MLIDSTRFSLGYFWAVSVCTLCCEIQKKHFKIVYIYILPIHITHFRSRNGHLKSLYAAWCLADTSVCHNKKGSLFLDSCGKGMARVINTPLIPINTAINTPLILPLILPSCHLLRSSYKIIHFLSYFAQNPENARFSYSLRNWIVKKLSFKK